MTTRRTTPRPVPVPRSVVPVDVAGLIEGVSDDMRAIASLDGYAMPQAIRAYSSALKRVAEAIK